jgi:hypothetical protein
MAGRRGLGAVAALAVGLAAALANDLPKSKDKPSDKPADPVVLVDSAGKEIRLTGVRMTAGVRRLAWLADRKGTTDDARKGPLALAVREPSSTTYQNGVLTLIPCSCVESVRYDYDKPLMTVSVKGMGGPVPGTLEYRGINAIGLEGKSGDILGKFTGGVPKDGFRSVAFPGARPVQTHPPGGIAWSVQIDQPRAGHPWLTVRSLKALYAFPGGVEQLTDTLPVRKGEPLAPSLTFGPALKKLEVVAVDPNTQTAVFDVTTDGGLPAVSKLVAVPMTREHMGKTGTLVGLVGEVDCGWKLFPLHCIKVIKLAERP